MFCLFLLLYTGVLEYLFGRYSALLFTAENNRYNTATLPVNWGNTGYAKRGHGIKKNRNFLVEIPVYYHVVYFIPVYYWHTPFGCAVVCGLTIPIPAFNTQVQLYCKYLPVVLKQSNHLPNRRPSGQIPCMVDFEELTVN